MSEKKTNVSRRAFLRRTAALAAVPYVCARPPCLPATAPCHPANGSSSVPSASAVGA